MEQLNLQMDLTSAEIKKMQMRYHFQEEDLNELCSFWQVLKPEIHAKAYYEVYLEKESLPKELAFIKELPVVVAIVTLGSGPDCLQELYLKEEQILSAYMIECFSMAVLEKAYELLNIELQKKLGLWINRYEFLGENYSLEKIEDILKCLKQNEVTYNEAFMLLPQKSVVFFGTLCTEPTGNHLCDTCKNSNCPNREKSKGKEVMDVLPYGKSLILNNIKDEEIRWKKD